MRLMDSFNQQNKLLDDQLLSHAARLVENDVNSESWFGEALRSQLREVQCEHGTELATAWLYQVLVRHQRHREFIEALEHFDSHSLADEFPFTVYVVPGAFYKEHSSVDSSGSALRKQLHQCGIETELIPVLSTGTLAQNAHIIRSFLRERAGQPMALISLSKGSADIKLAIQQCPDDFRDVRWWYSISGTLGGVELINWVQRRWWARWVNTLIFRTTRRNYQFFTDLNREADGLLRRPLECPEWLNVVHVAAFGIKRHMQTRLARVWYQRFQHLGPTDSMIMLQDLLDYLEAPHYVLPVWGVDHYWKRPEAAQQIARGFLSLNLLSDRAMIGPKID